MSLIIGAIPIAVVGLILRKATQLRHEETLDRYPVGGTVPVYALVAIALVFFGLALFFSGAFR